MELSRNIGGGAMSDTMSGQGLKSEVTAIKLLGMALEELEGHIGKMGGQIGGPTVEVQFYGGMAAKVIFLFDAAVLSKYFAQSDRIGGHSEITGIFEQAKKHAVRSIEVPPYAKFEIRWATESDEQTMDGVYQGSGPMLIVCTDD
jgi:hypothetical protein